MTQHQLLWYNVDTVWIIFLMVVGILLFFMGAYFIFHNVIGDVVYRIKDRRYKNKFFKEVERCRNDFNQVS